MKKYYLLGGLIILIGVFAVMYIPKETKSEQSEQSAQSIRQPTVFVHGYKGTYRSFGGMLHRFENKYNWGSKALVYQVKRDGSIHVRNNGHQGNDPAYVQVVFDSNRASFDDSASYLATVLRHMKENYRVNSINLVGHSMGGIVSLKFINEHLNENEYFPVVQKYVALGSPFDGIYHDLYFDINRDPGAYDLMPNSDELQSLLAQDNVFPKNIDALNIASTGDAVATPESASALQNIIPDSQLSKVLIENEYLGHSDLHESEKVDRIIHSFLFDD